MRNEKILFIIFQIFFIFLIIRVPVFAASDYVLPYPSYMPGSFMYNVRLVSEEIMEYWYFGNFAKFTYNLKQSDKYLVEAKTLSEYKQYFLGIKSLKKSDKYFLEALKYLKKAKEENKDISQKYSILKNASAKHTEVLEKIKESIPSEFLWQPEKAASTTLHLESDINNSIKIRMMNL